LSGWIKEKANETAIKRQGEVYPLFFYFLIAGNIMNPEVVKKAVCLFCLILVVFAAVLAVNLVKIEEKASSTIYITNSAIFNENFSEWVLNPQTWQITRKGNFKESTIDVNDADPTENVDYRLRLRANTIGAMDDTVKFHGVRSVEKMNFSDGKEISFDIDWNMRI
jgi:hypothetical protein